MTDFRPVPQVYSTENWEEWAGRLIEWLEGYIRDDTTAGTFRVYDTSGRLIIDESGVYAYDAGGNNPISPDIVQIDTAQLVDAAVETAKVADLNITEGKLANLAVATGKIQDAAIVTAKIANLAVTSALIADAAVVTAKIDDLAVNNAKIANLAVSTLKIQDLAITAAKIDNATITTTQIASATILDANIATGTITSAKIASLAADKITAGTIGAELIKLGADQFELDGTNVYLRIVDTQGSPQERIKIGKTGAGATDYGIQVRDDSGNLIVDIDGLGTNTVGNSQIVTDAVTTVKVTDGDIVNRAASVSTSTMELHSADPPNYKDIATISISSEGGTFIINSQFEGTQDAGTTDIVLIRRATSYDTASILGTPTQDTNDNGSVGAYTRTITYSVPAGSNRTVVVFVAQYSTSSPALNAAPKMGGSGGTSLTLIDTSINNDSRLGVYRILESDIPAGNQDIYIDANANSRYDMVTIIAVSGTQQIPDIYPIPNVALATNETSYDFDNSVTTDVANCLLLDGVCADYNSTADRTLDAGQTEIGSGYAVGGSHNMGASQKSVGAAGSHTMGWEIGPSGTTNSVHTIVAVAPGRQDELIYDYGSFTSTISSYDGRQTIPYTPPDTSTYTYALRSKTTADSDTDTCEITEHALVVTEFLR